MTDTERFRVYFDPDWYLAQNLDVAMAELDPWAHWVGFGRAEGRQPIRCRALELDMALWRGLEERALTGLGLLLDDMTPEPERGAAAWIMARWHASNGNLERALHDLDLFRSAHSARFLIVSATPTPSSRW